MKEKENQIKAADKGVATRRKSAPRAKRQNINTVTSNRLKLLITVVNREKTEYYVDLIQSFDVNLQAIALAKGTADAKTLRLLGLADSNKGVIFSVIQENKLPDALEALSKKFKTVKDGNGIAFTVPLTSVIGKLLFGFLSNNKSIVKEGK